MRKNPDKNLTQESYPDRGSNPGPLRDRRACYRLPHSGGLLYGEWSSEDCYEFLCTHIVQKERTALSEFELL